MSTNETELLKLVRENDNPVQALMTAIIIVEGYLKQHGLDSTPNPADLLVSS